LKATLQDLKTGAIHCCDVPGPELRPGGILVRTAFSAISAGTECARVEAAEKNLLGKALARPDLVRQVVDFARSNGIRAAYNKVKSRLDTLAPMGYSCSGMVIAVGGGVTDFRIGERVACAGGGYANHAEVNWVPSNLAVHVPDVVSLESASLTTIGAIAMQGLRQAEVRFGESVVVIGAGLVGILTIALARGAGCRVIAVDRDESRVANASAFGAQLAMLASDPRLNVAVQEFSRYGVDAAIVTAATRSAEPLELAARILRDRGRIVVVGDVGMGVSRANMYDKELTLTMSRSYGPGRYDPGYEEAGSDYPVGYVRWTERRNMEAFLDCLALRSIDITRLLERRYSIDESRQAYEALKSHDAYTVILEYPNCSEVQAAAPVRAPIPAVRLSGNLHVGCIGAGGFARSYIIPTLRTADRVFLEAVATASGVTAESARKNFGFGRTQMPSELLCDTKLDAVFIASRHSSHASYVCEALRNGKMVFVEKPLAVDRQQLESVRQAYSETANHQNGRFLMVGFNRRFAPATENVRRFFAGRQEPMVIHVRINAGFIPLNHWTQQVSEGGRIIGEFCHFVDWARNVVGSPISTVSAVALPDSNRYCGDNVTVTLTFADGSVANLMYLANGDSSVSKEHFEVFCEGAVARFEDFELLELSRGGKTKRTKSTRDKGHRRELQLTLQAMISGAAAPISFEEIVEVTEATFAVAEAIRGGQCVPLTEADPSLLFANG
jgi:predicted dehydrogenase/threonine dehydrogenase-like Zn-dependent dehydrogenase